MPQVRINHLLRRKTILSSAQLWVLLPFLFIFIVALSCDSKKNSGLNSSSTEKDSVRILIAQSKEDHVDPKLKILKLQQAYTTATMATSDSLKCKYFSEISFALTRAGDSVLFRKVNAAGLRLSVKQKDSTCIPNLHWDLGDFLRTNSVQDSAYYHYSVAEKIFTSTQNSLLSGVMLTQMASVQSTIGDYTGGEITAFKALEKLKPINANRQLSNCYNTLADITKLLNEYDRALQYYDQAIFHANKAEFSPLQKIRFKNNKGLVFQKMGQHQKAIDNFKAVINFDSLRYLRPRLYGRTLNNLGRSYLKNNETKELPGLFEQALAIQDSTNDIGGKASSSYELANYYLLKKDTTAAFVNLKRSKEFALQGLNNKHLLKILRLLPRADPQNAAGYAEQYISLNDSLQTQERQLRDKFTRIQFETDEVNAENQVLSRQKQLWTGIAATLLLLGLAAYIIFDQRTKNQKLRFEKQQQASNQEIFNLLLAQNEKVEEGKKSEQKRVSEELHDGVLGRMLGTRMMLLGLNKKTDPEAIAQRGKAIAILQDVEAEVRAISHELSHAAYQKIHNFIVSIQELITTVQTTSKIQIDLKYIDDLDYDAMNGNIKINLYRIVQEIIQNAVKHAACTLIQVNFEADTDLLRVTISDDGKGFKPKKGKKGIGMRNITSRMKKINGTWNIDSSIGNGTKITLEIPLVASDSLTNAQQVQNEVQEV